MHSRITRLVIIRPVPWPGTGRTTVLFAGLLCACGTAFPQAYLDLTTAMPDSPAHNKIPGDNSVGSAGPHPTVLPITVTVQDIYPAAVEASSLVTIMVQIRNVGKEAIAVPASRDFATALKTGNKEQRTLHVGLRIAPPDPFKPTLVNAGVAAGSPSVPGSLIVLAPQEYLLIRIHASLSESAKWHEEGLDAASIRVAAVVDESFLDSDEYIVKGHSQPVASSNAAELFWHF
jgi:hypothetical protein